MNVKLLACTPDPNHLIEYAGRVCTNTTANTGVFPDFVVQRINEGHESILEHASATFEISGISRACSHQLVRHRIASYSQESQRHVDMSDPELVVPKDIDESPEALLIWDDLMAHVIDAYSALQDLGIKKEDARFVLPNATATRIVVTMNFRELRHFFSLRLSPQAQWEIRGVAAEMVRLMAEEAPDVFMDFSMALKSEERREKLGMPPIITCPTCQNRIATMVIEAEEENTATLWCPMCDSYFAVEAQETKE